MAPCALCPSTSAPRRALLRRPKTLQPVCKECFYEVFETEIHHTILGRGQAEVSRAQAKASIRDGKRAAAVELATTGIFKRGERVAIGASGGKGTSRDQSA